MHVELRVDPAQLRRWHVDLIDQLSLEPGVTATVTWVTSAAGPALPEVERLFAVERFAYRLPTGVSQRVSSESVRQYVGATTSAPDVVLDLVGSAEPARVPTWRVLFDNELGEQAALAALLSGHLPHVAIVDGGDHSPVASGRPGSETPGIAVAAFEDVLAGTTTLLRSALTRRTTLSTDRGDFSPPVITTSRQRELKVLARAAITRVYRMLYRAPHWRVGWRYVDGPDMIDLLAHPSSGWRELPDDGRHFYADPFPIVVGGETHLFVEDFEHRLGRGVISVTSFDDHGPTGPPRPVLEHEAHLSYPFVVEDRGEVWMVPETSAAGTVELYRARRFPDEWVREAVLLEGLEVSDATPFQHAGRWWMTGTVRLGGSFSDALHIWSADKLEGPWRPHAGNPVLLDIASARPAGRVVSRGGRLIRPVQDGRTGYGGALAIAEITELTDDAFNQRILGRVGPGPQWPGKRLHTLNRAGRLECIDGSALSPRLWHRPPRARRG